MTRKKWTPLRRGDLVTRLVDGREIWYFDDYVQFDRFSPSKRVRKSTMCLKADYARAQEVRDEIRAKLKAGDAELRRALTFAEWVPIWRAQYEHEHPIAAGTVLCHNQALRGLLQFFGPKRLDRVTDGDCIEYRKWRTLQPKLSHTGKPVAGSTTSPNTVITDCRIASAIWRCAMRAGKVAKNPWDGVKLGAIGARTRVLSEHEQALVIGAADAETVRLILVTLGTSFRIGALLALPLDPIDWVPTKNGDIAMVRILSKGKVHAQPLLPIVVQAMEDQTAWVRAEHPHARRLFPYTRSIIYGRLQKLAKQVDIPPFSAHDIRRTFGTRSNESLTLADTALLLNNTPAVAAKHYVHPTDAADAVRKLRALSLMAPALLLPPVVTPPDSVEDRASEVVDE